MSPRRPRARGLGYKWIVLAAAGLATFHLGRQFYQGTHKRAYPPNAFYEVKRTDLLVSIVEDGALRALNETVVRSGLEGFNRIIQLVPEGSHVKKGDLLVELDSSGLKDRLNEQELAYQERLFQLLQATANLKIQKSLGESQIKEAELKVENAQSDLEKYRDGDAPLLIRTVEARSGVLAEQVRIARERYERTQELVKTGNATQSEVEADALVLKREQLGLGQYHEDLRLIKKFDYPKQVRLLESKVAQAQEELERLKQRTSNEIAQAEADLKTSQRSIDFLEESLKTQKQRLENARIVAPQDGLVVYAPVSPFQSTSGDDRRRDDRSRGARNAGGPGGGGGDASREFRGGGRRGNRLNSESGRDSTSSSSPAQTVSAGNQRIASAISGSAAVQPGSSSGGGNEGGGNSSGGSRSGGNSSGGSGSGGSGSGGSGSGGSSSGAGTASASSAFVSYPSMRPSSSFGSSSNGANSSGTGANGSGGNASGSFSSSNAPMASSGSPSGFRSNTRYPGDFVGLEFSGTPGVLEEGIMVRQRQELIRLPDVSKMLAEIKIHESRAGQVRVGMTAYVRIDSIPHRHFKGTVRRVALLPDSQVSWMNPGLKVFPTDVLIEDELPALRPGVSARAEIIITNLPQVLTVPIQTVARFRGENVCFVKRGRGVVPVPVTTGGYNDQFVEVISGLREGEQVLLAPVGDEAIEKPEVTETNAVESVTPPPERRLPPVEEAPVETRRMQRGNPDNGAEGDSVSEPRRSRPGGRRSAAPTGAPE